MTFREQVIEKITQLTHYIMLNGFSGASCFHNLLLAVRKSWIRLIPRGRVATYGQIAALAGSPRAALMAGRILRYSSESEKLPWQRVIHDLRTLFLK